VSHILTLPHLPTHSHSLTVSLSSDYRSIPWDMDGALGQDNGLGGAPGDKYCVLACEQWNSPLYCDAQHTQVSR
jgi:hypothetical protein